MDGTEPNPPLGSPMSDDAAAAASKPAKEEEAAPATAAAAPSPAAAAVEGRPDGLVSRATASSKAAAAAVAPAAATAATDATAAAPAAAAPAAAAPAPAGAAPAAAPAAEAPPAAAAKPPQKKPARPAPKRTLVGLLCTLAAIGAVVTLAALAAWLYKPMSKAWSNKRAPDHPSENFFDLGNGTMAVFPTLQDAPTLYLSVIVPAYNEEKRIPEERGIDDMIAHLSQLEAADATGNQMAKGWEIIVVDDGSKDGTAALVVAKYVREQGAARVRLLKCAANGGKGAAVRKGMLRARGKWLLMADADGATDIKALGELLARGAAVAVRDASGRQPRAFAVGSRAHLKKARSALRQFFSTSFHVVISVLLGGQTIQDTQCGFKLFTRAAARSLFGALHIERWAFDVELVYLAGLLGVPTVEVPVPWHEVGGSKLDPTSASIEMLRDIIVIRLAYLAGFWKVAV